MIETDPGSIEGSWCLAHEEEPDIGTVFVLRDGKVFSEDRHVGDYSTVGAQLTFRTVEDGADGSIWIARYAFELPGPLTDAEVLSTSSSQPARPDRLKGCIETTKTAGSGEDVEFEEPCIFSRLRQTVI